MSRANILPTKFRREIGRHSFGRSNAESFLTKKDNGNFSPKSGELAFMGETSTRTSKNRNNRISNRDIGTFRTIIKTRRRSWSAEKDLLESSWSSSNLSNWKLGIQTSNASCVCSSAEPSPKIGAQYSFKVATWTSADALASWSTRTEAPDRNFCCRQANRMQLYHSCLGFEEIGSEPTAAHPT